MWKKYYILPHKALYV